MTPPPLSVVVPTRDRPLLLDGCLEALRASLRGDDELIVADSASTDAAVLEVAASHGARLLRCGWPGTSRARNRGAAGAVHDVVAFVDDDVRVAREWAGALAGVLEAHPEAAFVTGRIEVPPHQAGAQRPVALLDRPVPEVLDARAPSLPGHGANLAVRRSALSAVGGFDERLGPGARFPAAEDHDLLDRLVSAGFTGRYEPSVRAWHDQWRGRWQLLGLEWSYGIGTGARLARLLRTDPGKARWVASETLWRTGLCTVPASVRSGYEFGVAFVLVRAVATAWGLALARTTRGFLRTPSGTPPPGHGRPAPERGWP